VKTKPESVPVAVHCDPQVMGGTPVFVGTRVPFQTLLDYIEAGDPLSAFLEDFPTVEAELAVAALEQAKEALFASAYSASEGHSVTEFLKSLPPGTRSAKEIDDEFRETRADRL